MLPTVTHDNAKGYWEKGAVMDLNNEILAEIGAGGAHTGSLS